MGYVEIIKVTPDQLDTCDDCNQQGLKTSGRTIFDTYGDPVLWFCFNCVQKTRK
jgi:hypothetical protein